jgi:hypothetical protein
MRLAFPKLEMRGGLDRAEEEKPVGRCHLAALARGENNENVRVILS